VLAELSPLEGTCVPRLVCEAQREGAAAVHLSRCRWPLLVIAPAGMSLCEVADALVARERERGGTRLECAKRIMLARRALADRVARGVLRTLKVAHARGIVHCDVRPANLVVLGDESVALGDGADVMLVDWGLSVNAGAEAVGRGVPAFAAADVFTQGSIVARARMDLVCVAHTWLAIAFGSGACAAPWATAPLEPLVETQARRSLWLVEHAAEVRAVAGLLQDLARPVEASSYEWPQPGPHGE
jgi:hypothetical protein